MTIEREHLRPSRPGLKVRMPYPSRDLLPEAGRVVSLTPWWRAKMNEGDVEIVPEKREIKHAAKPATAAATKEV